MPSYWDSAPKPKDAATLKSEVVEAALAERKPLCRHCFNPFIPRERPPGAMFECRSILMIPDAQPDPMLCDTCFAAVVTSFNRQATNIGTSNWQPKNLVLGL